MSNLEFELVVMEMVKDCKTVEDYSKMALQLHDLVEDAIIELCYDAGILDDYEPSF